MAFQSAKDMHENHYLNKSEWNLCVWVSQNSLLKLTQRHVRWLWSSAQEKKLRDKRLKLKSYFTFHLLSFLSMSNYGDIKQISFLLFFSHGHGHLTEQSCIGGVFVPSKRKLFFWTEYVWLCKVEFVLYKLFSQHFPLSDTDTSYNKEHDFNKILSPMYWNSQKFSITLQ